MTQELRKRFKTSVPYSYVEMSTDVDEQSEDKNESEDSHMRISDKAEVLIMELNSMHGQAKGKILELIETLKHDGLKEREIKKVIFDRVDFISKATLYRALPQEYKKEYTKPLPKTINISSEHKVIDVEPYKPDPDWNNEKQDKSMEIVSRHNEQEREPITPYDGNLEDPKDTEIDFLKEKVSELEDALRKTEQFKPANKLTEEQAKDMVMQAVQTGLTVPQLKLNEDTIFKWIADKADGTHSFYYDTYGIELFQNRILSQLKNSGVKVFKRLYFEI